MDRRIEHDALGELAGPAGDLAGHLRVDALQGGAGASKNMAVMRLGQPRAEGGAR